MWPPYTPLPPSYKSHLPVAIDIAPILFSGGMDMNLVMTPAALPSSTITRIVNPLMTSVEATFGDSYQRRLGYVSGPNRTCALKVARKARIVSCMRDDAVTFWRIPILKKWRKVDQAVKELMEEEEMDEEARQKKKESEEWRKMLEMELNVKTNLMASQLSDDGKWFVCSDLYEVKLYRLELTVCPVSLSIRSLLLTSFLI
jgi:U3 small nucleolar RNA-associated protein 4